jgi:hypothetical protein
VKLTEEIPHAPWALGWGFTGFFALELLLKLLVHRGYFFVCGAWRMNWLDFILVLYSCLEAVAMKLSFLRILRMFKMAKMVRMLKALAAVHDLRIMIDCLLGSFFGLFWALVLIGVIMYIFALIFVQAFTEYLIEEGDSLSPVMRRDIENYFGSVSNAVLSVYMMLTGGIDWGDMYALLDITGVIAGPACLVMVSFFTISVWNIITSVFIEKAMQLATPTVRELVQRQKQQAKVDAHEVADLFSKLDHDSTGFISRDEFREICADHEIQEFLAVRDLDLKHVSSDSDLLFDMIMENDFHDGATGTHREVSVGGLVRFCLHLKGKATNMDLHKEQFHTQGMLRKMHGMLKVIVKEVQAIQQKRDFRV